MVAHPQRGSSSNTFDRISELPGQQSSRSKGINQQIDPPDYFLIHNNTCCLPQILLKLLNALWNMQSSQELWKQQVMQNLGRGQTESIMG